MADLFEDIVQQQIEARKKSEQDSLVHLKKYVCFMLNDREYAFDIEYVQEIIEIGYIRKIIYMPQFLVGVINLRGSIIAVVDLKQLFHLGVTDLRQKSSRLIICKFEGKSITFVVDGIRKIRELSSTDVQRAPVTFNEIPSQFVIGMFKTPEENLLVLLNFAEIINTDEIKQLVGENAE